MIIGDRKKAVTTILSKFNPDGPNQEHEEMPETEMNSGDETFHMIASDILSAIEGKSPNDLAMALKAFAAEVELDGHGSDGEV